MVYFASDDAKGDPSLFKTDGTVAAPVEVAAQLPTEQPVGRRREALLHRERPHGSRNSGRPTVRQTERPSSAQFVGFPARLPISRGLEARSISLCRIARAGSSLDVRRHSYRHRPVGGLRRRWHGQFPHRVRRGARLHRRQRHGRRPALDDRRHRSRHDGSDPVRQHPLQTLQVLNGSLYFLGFDFSSMTDQLWTSDGTAAGTVAVTATGGTLSTVEDLTAVGSTIFFVNSEVSGTSPQASSQLWEINGGIAAPVTPSTTWVASPSDLTAPQRHDPLVHGRRRQRRWRGALEERWYSSRNHDGPGHQPRA